VLRKGKGREAAKSSQSSPTGRPRGLWGDSRAGVVFGVVNCAWPSRRKGYVTNSEQKGLHLKQRPRRKKPGERRTQNMGLPEALCICKTRDQVSRANRRAEPRNTRSPVVVKKWVGGVCTAGVTRWEGIVETGKIGRGGKRLQAREEILVEKPGRCYSTKTRSPESSGLERGVGREEPLLYPQ